MRWFPVVLVLAVGSGVIMSPAAHAEPERDASVLERARKHFERGERHYRRGEYHRAAAAYSKAYELTEHPELLYNVAQAYRLGGRPAEALEHYRSFLEEAPDHDAAPQARRLIAELERSVASRETEEPDADPDPVPEPEPKPGAGRGLRIAGIITAGAGVVAAGVGVKFGLDAQAASNAIEGHQGGWTDELLDRQRQGKIAEQRMFVFAGVGAAAVVAGGTLYYFGAKARVAPSVTRDEVSLALVGTF